MKNNLWVLVTCLIMTCVTGEADSKIKPLLSQIKKYPSFQIVLKKGELWKKNSTGTQAHQLTYTLGKVHKYKLSPSEKYLAFTVVVGTRSDCWADDPALLSTLMAHPPQHI